MMRKRRRSSSISAPADPFAAHRGLAVPEAGGRARTAFHSVDAGRVARQRTFAFKHMTKAAISGYDPYRAARFPVFKLKVHPIKHTMIMEFGRLSLGVPRLG